MFIGSISAMGAGMLSMFQHYIAWLMAREINDEDNLSAENPRAAIAGKLFDIVLFLSKL